MVLTIGSHIVWQVWVGSRKKKKAYIPFQYKWEKFTVGVFSFKNVTTIKPTLLTDYEAPTWSLKDYTCERCGFNCSMGMRSWPLPATGWHNQIAVSSEELGRWKERGREAFSARFTASSHLLVAAADFLGYYIAAWPSAIFTKVRKVANFSELPSYHIVLSWPGTF